MGGFNSTIIAPTAKVIMPIKHGLLNAPIHAVSLSPICNASSPQEGLALRFIPNNDEFPRRLIAPCFESRQSRFQ
jgi:hypothetical protein